MLSPLLRTLTAGTAMLLVPAASLAQEVTEPASAARMPPSSFNPFFSGTLLTSYVWWGIVIAVGVVGVLVLQRFLNK